MLPPDIFHRDASRPDAVLNRRLFLKASAAIGLVGPVAAGQQTQPSRDKKVDRRDPRLVPPFQRPDVFPAQRAKIPPLPQEVNPALTPRLVAASHNNFYEVLPNRAGDLWAKTRSFVVEPWKLEVVGECRTPATFDLDDLFKFAHEERLYHFRCVERWAMNVPWSGFPLRRLLETVEPTDHARFVRFVTVHRPEQMPGMKAAAHYPWPYHEALRMDEATNDLTLVATGIFGEPLLKQHGAPVRIVVPWKYGYKSPKSIVRIELVRKQPKTFWQMQPHEYGFLSNVNPFIPHPRWSQAESQWLGRREQFATPMFNGYEEYVADLYPDEPRTVQTPLSPGQVAR